MVVGRERLLRGSPAPLMSFKLVLAVCALCACLAPRQAFAHRPVSAATVWFTNCDNTIETRDNVTDETGRLCSRDKLDYTSGCCERGEASLHDCSRCKSNECCETYEHCVSCCMGSSKTEDYIRSQEVFKVPLHPESGVWDNKWDYCTGQCRTNPLGTIYEHRYKDTFKHCYSKYPIPANTFHEKPRELKVEMGLRGQSCESVCAEKGMRCAPQHFEFVNLCESIHEYTGFKCKYCKIKDNGTGNIGGPVVQYFPNNQNFGIFDGNCIQEKRLGDFSCDLTTSERYNRVCPCM